MQKKEHDMASSKSNLRWGNPELHERYAALHELSFRLRMVVQEHRALCGEYMATSDGEYQKSLKADARRCTAEAQMLVDTFNAEFAALEADKAHKQQPDGELGLRGKPAHRTIPQTYSLPFSAL